MSSCPNCHHAVGYRGRHNGCNQVEQHGNCNDDVYCNCKNEYHYYDRCSFVDMINKEKQGVWYKEPKRCKKNVYKNGIAFVAPSNVCETHISRLDKARLDLQYEEEMAAYYYKCNLELKINKTNEAVKFLKSEGYILIEPNIEKTNKQIMTKFIPFECKECGLLHWYVQDCKEDRIRRIRALAIGWKLF